MNNQTKYEIITKAKQYASDLEKHIVYESAQGQLSPTDLALLEHISYFLNYELPIKINNGELFDDNQNQEVSHKKYL